MATAAMLRRHTGSPRVLHARDARSWIPQHRNTQRHQSFPPPGAPANSGTTWSGNALVQMMKKTLGEELWREKEKLALAWLEETLPTLKGPLTSDAWLGGGGEVTARYTGFDKTIRS